MYLERMQEDKDEQIIRLEELQEEQDSLVNSNRYVFFFIGAAFMYAVSAQSH
jgi:hypothetical protein